MRSLRDRAGEAGAVLIIFGSLVLFGLILWWPAHGPPDRQSDLGAAIVGGALVGVAVALLERSAERRAANGQLRLQLVQQDTHDGLFASRADLSRLYLTRKLLSNSTLDGADLRHATLYRSVLAGASLRHTDLRDADAGRVVLEKADLTGARLDGIDLGYADLRGALLADTRGLSSAKLLRALVDKETTWPAEVANKVDALGVVVVDDDFDEPYDCGPEGYHPPRWSSRREGL